MTRTLFDWTLKEKWLAEIDIYAANLLTSNVKSRLRRRRPKCWSDDFEWLSIPDGAEEFAQCFEEHYSHIRVFHACRPADIESYVRNGLQGQEAGLLEEYFKRIFSDVPEPHLKDAFAEFSERKKSEAGRLWVVLTQAELIQDCGHYLIQGSEFMMALAATLSRIHPKEDYRLRLRSIGIPTIFEAHVPTTSIPETQIEGLSRLVLSAWGEKATRRSLGTDHHPCLTLRRTIEPACIVNHSHPKAIRDPHFGRTTYINPFTTCPACAN